jgi:hypothetical protein
MFEEGYMVTNLEDVITSMLIWDCLILKYPNGKIRLTNSGSPRINDGGRFTEVVTNSFFEKILASGQIKQVGENKGVLYYGYKPGED